jgi:crotonobetainyl-CoA hydratase
MTEDGGIRTERRGKVLIITMDRPKANAINHAMSRAMYRAFEELQSDPELLVGVLESADSRIFSAGWDLKEVAVGIYRPEDYFDPEKGHGPGGIAGIVENFALDKPVIAAVNGAAVGAGFEITLACDMIIATEDAFFQLPEMQLGLLPDAGGVQRLPRQIPPKIAAGLILTGRRMSAAEGKGWGLVHDVVPAQGLREATMQLAEGISHAAPLALRALKATLRQNEDLPLRETFVRARPGKTGLPIVEKMLGSEDFFEGPRAFSEKRPPRWKGR